jgi:hypothetical protein
MLMHCIMPFVDCYKAVILQATFTAIVTCSIRGEHGSEFLPQPIARFRGSSFLIKSKAVKAVKLLVIRYIQGSMSINATYIVKLLSC